MSRETRNATAKNVSIRGNAVMREYNFEEDDPSKERKVENFQNRLYKMYEVPASFHKAHIHEEAYKFGVNSISGKVDTRGARCECCDYYIAYKELDLCHDVEIKKAESSEERNSHGSYQNLPVGVSLYFSFIKMVTWYMLIRFIVFDLYNLYLSVFGEYCAKLNRSHSTDLCSITSSGYNLKGNTDTHVLDILNFAFTLISIAYFINFKNFQEEQRIDARHESVNEEDFSVILQNVPAVIYNRYDEINDATCDHELELKRILEKRIRNWLQKFDESEGTKKYLQNELQQLKKKIRKSPRDKNDLFQDIVKKITICYDLTEIENMDNLRDKLIEEIEHIDEKQSEEFAKLLNDEGEGSYTKQMRETTMIQFVPNQIKMINSKYIALCENFLQHESSEKKSTEFKLSHFTGRVIVTFQYQHFRDYLIREYEENHDFLQINNNSISISRANKPSEIYWFNLKLTDEDRNTRTYYSWGILIMLLIISLAAFLGLEILQSLQVLKTNQDHVTVLQMIKRYAVTASTGILTTAINFFLGYVIQLLAKMEKHKTKSERLTSLVSKMIVTQTINSSFIYLILYFIQPINPLGEYGLANKIISVVIVSGFANIATSILRPGDIYARFQNRRAEDNTTDKQSLKTVQIKLNKKYEMPKFQIAEGYAFYIVIIFTISFYSFIVPLATPIAVGVFIVQYWVEKYNLFRRSSPIDFGYALGKDIFTIFEVTLFFFTFGYFLWDLHIHSEGGIKIKPLNIISLVISAQYAGFYLFVPQGVKNKIIGNQEKMYFESYDYYQKADKFKTTYDSENPATAFLMKDKNIPKKMGEVNIKILEKGAPNKGSPPPPPNYQNYQ